jgi:hypothetical protein
MTTFLHHAAQQLALQSCLHVIFKANAVSTVIQAVHFR